MLGRLRELGIRSLMVEGGSGIITSLLRAGLVDRLVVCIAPKVLGRRAGRRGRPRHPRSRAGADVQRDDDPPARAGHPVRRPRGSGGPRRRRLRAEPASGRGGRRAGGLVRRAGAGRDPRGAAGQRSAEAEILVRAERSAISHGTEMLVYRGQVPPDTTLDLPTLAGSFDFPIKYGYASVGTVLEVGGEVEDVLAGDRVFCLHPHQTAYVVPADLAWRLPRDLDPERGVFAANVETALNVLLDTPGPARGAGAGVRAGDGGAADRAAGASERGRAGRRGRSVRAAAGAGARRSGRTPRSIHGCHARTRSRRRWAAGRTWSTRRAAARPRSRRPSRPSPTRAR